MSDPIRTQTQAASSPVFVSTTIESEKIPEYVVCLGKQASGSEETIKAELKSCMDNYEDLDISWERRIRRGPATSAIFSGTLVTRTLASYLKDLVSITW